MITNTSALNYPVASKRASRMMHNTSRDDITTNSISQSSSVAHIATNLNTNEMNLQNKSTDRRNNVRLVISNGKENVEKFDDISTDKDTQLATLVEEYRDALNRKDCESTSCYQFKLLSYRISQSLFDRIHCLKEQELKRKSSEGCPNENFASHIDVKFDNNNNVFKLIEEKDKRIQDLERLLEEQKRLRLQDANQVEEKAARIKEWVANKLKELENQNKRLREQNKRQKEEIESLNKKILDLNLASRNLNKKTDSIHFIDQTSPLDAIDVEGSLKNRRPLLKKIPQISMYDIRADESLCLNFRNREDGEHEEHDESELIVSSSPHKSNIKVTNNSIIVAKNRGRDSPVYDSVAVEQVNRYNSKIEETLPPLPPPHQADKWELQLYNLADETFSTLIQESDEQGNSLEDDKFNTDKDSSSSRKSSSSLKNDLISLMKPSFTTIYGDKVVDSLTLDIYQSENEEYPYEKESFSQENHRKSSEQSLHDRSRESFNDQFKVEKTITPNLFDSPLRSRSGKDRMLRTQSVRKNPTPEILYDFITTDLIKRGPLMKPGALKNHSRWIVLKNFQLYSYKNELDETTKATPSVLLKLDPTCLVHSIGQTGEANYPIKITCNDKHIQLIASTAQEREEWMRILTVAISLSDIDIDSLAKQNSTYEGVLSFTRHGHTRKCHAIINRNVIFFLKSSIDPTPLSYLSLKGARIRELTDSLDYGGEEKEPEIQDCSLAIYPKFSILNDPVYITLGSQQETDKWFYYLSLASGIDQSYGTQFEQALTKLMIRNSMSKVNKSTELITNFEDGTYSCPWKELSILIYTDKPISQPLTSLPNETLKVEAVELFKSILLFTQVPLEPVAIDYHVSLLQNCLSRFFKYPELRNEFYAQLIKQCTYIFHQCESKSSVSSGSSPTNTRSSTKSISNGSSECKFVTDFHVLETVLDSRRNKLSEDNSVSIHGLTMKTRSENLLDEISPPTQSELLQVLQILAISVSINLPRGRMRWWLTDYLKKFANHDTNVGKYALYILRAVERALQNGSRDNIPSRTEIMSILLRNPYDHSNPHSIPIGFADGSCLVVEADGSTTVEEFMTSMNKHINVRHSSLSDFYLFSDDPSGSRDLHILEPQRKVLDIVGWWEQTSRKLNSGRFQNTKSVKLLCRKRLVLQAEADETQQERSFIVYQVHNEIVSQRIPLNESLTFELTAVMAQLAFGESDRCKEQNMLKCVIDKIAFGLFPKHMKQAEHWDVKLIDRWKKLSGRSAQDCIRVYLNCVRRLKLKEKIGCSN